MQTLCCGLETVDSKGSPATLAEDMTHGGGRKPVMLGSLILSFILIGSGALCLLGHEEEQRGGKGKKKGRKKKSLFLVNGDFRFSGLGRLGLARKIELLTVWSHLNGLARPSGFVKCILSHLPVARISHCGLLLLSLLLLSLLLLFSSSSSVTPLFQKGLFETKADSVERKAVAFNFRRGALRYIIIAAPTQCLVEQTNDQPLD